MDEILRQRDPELKAAVEASLAGDIGKAFDKLGSNVAEVKADNVAGAVAARWLALSPEERARTGGDRAEPRASRGHQRAYPRAARPRGCHRGTRRWRRSGWSRRAIPTQRRRLAPTTLPATSWHSTVPTSVSGVEKGDERRVAGVDHRNRTVHLEGPDGKTVAWKPSQVGARKGGTEVYRAETIELRAGRPHPLGRATTPA